MALYVFLRFFLELVTDDAFSSASGPATTTKTTVPVLPSSEHGGRT
jgi:hypothetical protein